MENEVPAEMIGLCTESYHVISFGYRLPNILLRFLRTERQTESIPYEPDDDVHTYIRLMAGWLSD